MTRPQVHLLAKAATIVQRRIALNDLQQPVEHGADGTEQRNERDEMVKSLFPQGCLLTVGEFSAASTGRARAGIALWRRDGVVATEAVASITERRACDKVFQRSNLRVERLRLVVDFSFRRFLRLAPIVVR